MNADANKQTAAFGWIGIVAVAAFIAMWIACYAVDGAWEWGVNDLSDFGVSDTGAASIFNYGCIIVGIVLAIYGIGKVCNYDTYGHKYSGLMIAFSGICFSMVGVFSTIYGNGDYHHFFASLTGLFLAAAIVASSAQEWKDGKQIIAGIAIVIACIVTACMVMYPFAEFEVWALVLAAAWLAIDAGYSIASSIKGVKQ